MQFGMPTLIELKSVEACASICRELGLKFIEPAWICLIIRQTN